MGRVSEIAVAETPHPRVPARDGHSVSWFWGQLADILLVAAFLAVAFLLGCFPLKDTDFWWHLKTGDWIRAHGMVPRTDLFTFTVADHPWIDLHWGFQVGLSWVYQHWGVVGVNLAKCGLTCGALLLLITARKREWPVWVMILAWLPALMMLSGRMYVRPETVSLVHLAAFLAILFRIEQRPTLALLLPVVQFLWVNSQGLFVLGPILLGCALIDACLRPGAFASQRRRWWRIVGLASALTFLACVLNPYGIEGTLFPLALTRTMSSPIFQETIAELTPIPLFIQRNVGLGNVMLLCHLGTMLLGALSFLVPICWTAATRITDGRAEPTKKRGAKGGSKRRGTNSQLSWRLSGFRLLIFLLFSGLSWQATRNSHQFAAVVGAVSAWNFGEWAAALAARRSSKTPKDRAFARSALPRVVVLMVLGIWFVAVATGAFYRVVGEGRVVGLGYEPLWYPREAVKFAGLPEMPPRFASFSFGWASLYDYEHGPDRKVFIDPRLEVAGPELYERYINLERKITSNAPGWDRELDELGRPLVMIGHAGLNDPGEMARTGAALLGHPDWRLIYFDPQASIYVHESYEDVVRRHEVSLAARHFRHEPETEPHGIPALLAGARSLWSYSSALKEQGRYALLGTVLQLGMDYTRRVLSSEPENGDSWKLLALLLSSREAMGEEPVPRYRQPFDPIFDLDTVRATYALRYALELKPNDYLLQLALALSFQGRELNEAAAPLIERLAIRPPINEYQKQLQRELASRNAALSGKFPPLTTTNFPNRNAIEQAMNGWLVEGRASSVADVMEREFPPEARSWPLADRLATIRLHLGRPDQARELWLAVADPPRPGLRAARVALTYFAEGNFEAARRGYREAIKAEPDLFEALYGLAILEADDGRATEAARAAGLAVKHAPSDVARTAAQVVLESVSGYADEPVESPPA